MKQRDNWFWPGIIVVLALFWFCMFLIGEAII